MVTKGRVVSSLAPRSKKEQPGPGSLLQGKAGLGVEGDMAQRGGWGKKHGHDPEQSPPSVFYSPQCFLSCELPSLCSEE